MSCELKTLAAIDDLAAVRSSLKLDNDAWLSTVHCAIAPSSSQNGLIVLAHGCRFVILHGAWDAQAQRQHYTIEHSDTLPLDVDDSITAVTCIPIPNAFGQHHQRHKHSSSSSASASAAGNQNTDWTCVVLGFASGCVRFYSELGEVLACQLWQPHEPVQHVKWQTGGKHSSSAGGVGTDELHVFQATCVCIVQGGALVQLLRNRNSRQQARKDSNASGMANAPSASAAVETLPSRKWTYGGKSGGHVTDAIVVGPQRPTAFDHLLSASRDGGFYAQYKAAPPQNALIVGVGAKPFVGFHWAKEGFVQPVLTVVARAVAHQIKSALPSWLTGGSSSAASSTGASASAAGESDDAAQPSAAAVSALPPAEPMQLRFGLCDQTRIAVSVWLAPDRQHAAVSDNLGRVMLVDCVRGIAVRMWKGYRDAQCAFVQANEPRPSLSSKDADSTMRRRRAMFLVIYAPKRACLECWLLQRGVRVAAFNVPKGGRLLGVAAQIGAQQRSKSSASASSSTRSSRSSASSSQASSSASSVPPLSCLFLDGATGELRELYVPFHCALSDEYARTSKDLHLLRRIKLCVRNSSSVDTGNGSKNNADADIEAEVRSSCEALQTDEMRLKCVEMLVRNAKTRPGVLRVALQTILATSDLNPDEQGLADEEEKQVKEIEVIGIQYQQKQVREQQQQSEQLYQKASVYLGIVELYVYLKGSDNKHTPDAGSSDEPKPLIDLSVNELENIEQFVTLKVLETASTASHQQHHHHSPNSAKVTFTPATKSTWFADYLAIFEPSTPSELPFCTNAGAQLRSDCRAAALAAVGEQLFASYIDEEQRSIHGLADALRASGIRPDDLMRLLLAHWLDRTFAYTSSTLLVEHLTRFGDVMLAICDVAGAERVAMVAYNEVSDWWQSVREQLLESRNSVHSWLAAMVCRALAARLSRDVAAELAGGSDAGDVTEEVWEQLPQEAAEWSLLVDKLDDVAVLALALGSSLQTMTTMMLDDDAAAGAATMPQLAFDGGSAGNRNDYDVSLSAIVCGGKGIVSELVARWIIALSVSPEALLERHGVPDEDGEVAVSLLPAPFAPYWHFLRNRFPFSLQPGVLLSHMAWEYMCHWSKHMADMDVLQAALRCLAAIPAAEQSLKHGLCCMIWNAHLKIPLQATSKLINKTGRLPTETLCLQDIGLSASLVADLLEHSLSFWEQFISSGEQQAATAAVAAPKMLRHEELLQDGPVALAQLAIEQAPASAVLLRLHHELIQTLLMMAALNLRLSKPVQTVFDAMSLLAFFTEINRNGAAVVLPPPDAVLQRKRTEFLMLVIGATMDLIRVGLEGDAYLDEHVAWMERVQKLSSAWAVSADDLRRHQIAELYAHGWDTYAEQQFDAVLDVAALGEVLLRLAGRRLNKLMRNQPRMYAEVASVGSIVTDFLDKLHNSNDRFERSASTVEVSLDPLIGLAVKAFTCLAETEGRDKRIAAQLFDACQRLKEQQLLQAEAIK